MEIDANSMDFGQPLLPQIRQWLLRELEAPYSAIESNVLMIALALAFVGIGFLISWTARHQDQVRRFASGLRRRARFRWAERYLRKGLAFLLRRFDVAGAYGLSFSIALASLLTAIWLFGNIVEALLSYNLNASVDRPVAGFIDAHRIAWQTTVMQVAILPATGVGLALAAGGVFVFLHRQRKPTRLPRFLIGVVAGAGAMDLAIDHLIIRYLPPETGMAVPTAVHDLLLGQTLICVSYGAMAYLIAATLTAWRSKVLVWSAASLVAVLTGIARIYLGADWLTDIVGRWVLALLWLSAALVVAAIIEQTAGADHASEADAAGDDLPEIDGLLGAPSASDFSRPESSIDGLSQTEVTERQNRGQVNEVRERTSRSVAEILWSNIFTPLNALLAGLFAIILLVGGAQDAVFGLVVVANIVIGVVQELRAKRTLDRLSVLVTPRVRVVRDGNVEDMPADRIVIDDVIECRPGDQVPVDGILLGAHNLEINESLLTGEAEPIARSRGDLVLSGSFVVAGSGRLQAVQIGEASYARRLARTARQFTLSQSQLRNGVNDMLRYVIWALVPTVGTLYLTQLIYSPAGPRDAAVSSVAAVVGMVPEGLVLLMSTIMAIAVIRLARHGAIVQELAAVELLARVDVICSDKTGTLTEGQPMLEAIIPANAPAGHPSVTLAPDVDEVLGVFAHDDASPTASSIALRDVCPRPDAAVWSVTDSVPFASSRKWSAFTFAGRGTWFLGAPEIVLGTIDEAQPLLALVDDFTKQGKRVLALASSSAPCGTDGDSFILPASRQPQALIVLGEKIRADVVRTMRYFEEQGVVVKVVSGDHAQTIQAIAAQAGMHVDQQAYDARNLPDDPAQFSRIVENCSLFGRVTPTQKRQMVQSLQANGHVVAMIGDGVNDVLAIKEADFGIALGSGTSASRAVAQLILLKDNFAALPAVIAEGRAVIANVERTANLFVTKTVYVFALALAIGIAQAPFPFLPRHLTLVSFLTIGAPGIFLSFARGTSVVQPGFVGRVLRFTLPAGAISAAATLMAYAAARALVPDDTDLARTAATIALTGCGLIVLRLLVRLRGLWHWACLAILPAILFIVLATAPLRNFFALELPTPSVWLAIIAIDVAAALALLAAARFNVGPDRR